MMIDDVCCFLFALLILSTLFVLLLLVAFC